MLFRIATILILSYVFMFGLWSKPLSAPFTENNDSETIEMLTVATSTEKIVNEKPKPETNKIASVKKEEDAPQISQGTLPQKPEVLVSTSNETAPTQETSDVDFEKINNFSRQATVNILCSAKNSEFSPISGTGIIINKEGLILTNAHVAQYFLLKDLHQKDFIQCVIRTGSPAYPRYNAELVYISPSWVETNKAEIKSQNPTGTGEFDYAFVRITGSIDGSNLPEFSYINVDERDSIVLGEPVVLVSYPAGFLGGLSILQGLSVASAITNIQDFYTFKENTIDLVSVGGTIISQKGASGGAVVDKNSSLIGIITTSSNGETTSSRSLNAITLSYINRAFEKESGLTIYNLSNQDLASYAKSFGENTAPGLSEMLVKEINKN